MSLVKKFAAFAVAAVLAVSATGCNGSPEWVMKTDRYSMGSGAYLDIMMTVSSIMLIRSGTQESLDKKKDLWQYLKKKDAGLYYKLYFGIFGRAMNIPGKGGRKVSVLAYKLANKVMGFN